MSAGDISSPRNHPSVGSHYSSYLLMESVEISRYPGLSSNSLPPLGSRAQVDRAVSEVFDWAAFSASQRLIVQPVDLDSQPSCEAGDTCGCQIAENGLIDPSNCIVRHSLAPSISISRWCTESIFGIPGASYLHGWSGWAAPAVFKLLGRWPRAESVASLWRASARRTRHPNNLVLVRMPDSQDGVPRTGLGSTITLSKEQASLTCLVWLRTMHVSTSRASLS